MKQSGRLEVKPVKPVKPGRQAQVPAQINNLESSIEVLYDKIGCLTDRLSSVLRQSVPPEQKESQDRVELVNLACTIETFGDSVRSASYKIEDILERIEL